jgi:hypothetical protein
LKKRCKPATALSEADRLLKCLWFRHQKTINVLHHLPPIQHLSNGRRWYALAFPRRLAMEQVADDERLRFNSIAAFISTPPPHGVELTEHFCRLDDLPCNHSPSIHWSQQPRHGRAMRFPLEPPPTAQNGFD